MILKRDNNRAVLATAICFSVLFAVSCWYIDSRYDQWDKVIRSSVLEGLVSKKSKLEKALNSRIYYTKGVAAYVSLNPNITASEFYVLASELIKNDTSVINTMSISKDCIIGAIYPHKGHEAAIGLDLRAHPERVEIVDKTIETRETFVAGPVELVEGGIAFISYTPIFDKTKNGAGSFWGITDIVIVLPTLLQEAGLKPHENGFELALRGHNGTGAKGEVFFGDKSIFHKDPVSVAIDLPNGKWILASVPIKGWSAFNQKDLFLSFFLLFGSLIISILVGLLVKTMAKTRTNEKRMKAIFSSLDSLIIEFDKNGVYLNIPTPNSATLMRQANEMLGKSVAEIFDKPTASLFMDGITNCLLNKDLIIVEYPLMLKGKKHWFQGRISYKDQNTVIFNAVDISQNKEYEESIVESNYQKDDLISELATQKEYLESQHDEIKEQKKQITNSISYASRIQDAMLTTFDDVKKIFPESFVILKPKHIVSGDFYWFKEVEVSSHQYKLFTAVDCTGHGVPGAFMSMLGTSFLNAVVFTDELDVAKILNQLRQEVKNHLHQESGDGLVKDGMDMALCAIDYAEMKLQYAGANNPLYIIRNIDGETATEIEEIKADKMPIGIYIKEKISFTKHVFDIKKGDLLYVFSDGFVDQFGGSRGDKFKKKRFKELLLSVAHLPIHDQKNELENTLKNWMGSLYEQVDDILVLGVQV